MKVSLSFVIAAFSTLSLIASQNVPKCSRTPVRKEARTLSDGEWNTLLSTASQMHTLGWFMWFSFLHVRFFDSIHFVGMFFPWHRRFIREFEGIAQYYNPNFVLHYWDATIDASDPRSSPILTTGRMGGNGGPNGCVNSGFQSGWVITLPGMSQTCLSRDFSGMSTYDSPEIITSVIQSSQSYGDFRPSIEMGIHAQVHNSIGGAMGQKYSPSDFIFFLHHSNIDRIWWQFQRARPENLWSYNSANNEGSISLNDQIPVFTSPVGDVMVVGYGSNCYSYDNAPANNRRDDTTTDDPSDIAAVVASPEMNLATGVSASTIDKYFPLLAADDTNPNSVAMPNFVSTKAANYAKSNKGNASKYSKKPVPAGTISDSIVSTANTIAPGYTAPVNVSASSKPQLKIPPPLPLEYILMCKYDVDQYNKMYANNVQLINQLNADGYVSPYV
ncbi:hypothetical protein BB558_000432 [Smittium angustum]|uniref:Tyrosinase copper-binding domain-containing protein n=1 Tax=Smittium angustum TaxID=133377 RepID=A0A2U1JE60_SMIAN|nr:hypothetical protein BB558_000432 [Smittium angustum]